MGDKRFTRRRTLQLSAAGLTAGLAGCPGGGGNGNGNGSASDSGNGNGNVGSADQGAQTTTAGETETASGATSPMLDAVPSGATGVVRLEVGRLLDGPVVRGGVEQMLSLLAEQQPDYAGPQDYETVLTLAEQQLGLDPRGISTVTGFGSVAGTAPESAALVMEAEWSASQLVDTIETRGEASLTRGSYNGATVYESEQDSGVMAVLPDGRFVLGERPAVESVVDTAAGDADPVSGRVVSLFQQAPEGPIRFGADLTQVSSMAAGPASNVEAVWGGMAASGNQRRLLVEMEASDETVATQYVTLLEQGTDQIQSDFQQGGQEMPSQIQEAVAELDDVVVERDGTTVPSS